jgi:23S rRNA (guanosine2251-2'-O)-methyltransferase
MIIYGRNTVIEALRAETYITDIYLEEQLRFKNPHLKKNLTRFKNQTGSEGQTSNLEDTSSDKIELIHKLARDRAIDIEYISHNEVARLAKSDEHQGVACKMEFQTTSLKSYLDNKDNLAKSMIYISEATYEHNVGAIIRSAECAGIGAVIIPNTIQVTSTIAKISTGALFYIPIIQEPIFQAIKVAKSYGIQITGIEREGKTYYKEDLNIPTLFIIGGEDKSLSDTVRKECDTILEIPQYGQINSLNMSVASSIIMFESARQRNP